MQLLRSYAISLLGFGAGLVIRWSSPADEEEAKKKESNTPIQPGYTQFLVVVQQVRQQTNVTLIRKAERYEWMDGRFEKWLSAGYD